MPRLNDIASEAKRRLQRQLRSGDLSRMNDSASRGSAVARYAIGTIFNKSIGSIVRTVSGAAGKIIEAITRVGRRPSRQDLNEAAEILQSLGGQRVPNAEDISRDPEVLDALKVLESEGVFGPPSQPPGRPPGNVITPDSDEWPEEHDIELLPRAEYPRLGEQALTSGEHYVNSSNVYSFAWQQTDRRYGILYVTFLGWTPGSGSRGGKGPMYAYYDVPTRIYTQFKRAATNGSAGGAVWDYLRVRGSRYQHQYQYNLQAGSAMAGGGTYVPRKATRRGFRDRALADTGTRQRGYIRSTLPEQLYPRERGLR